MIIVLCGVRGSGKDTIGDILRDNHGFTKEAFANPLKAMVKHAFPAFTDEDLYGPSKNRERGYKEYPLTSCPWCGGNIIYDKYDNRDGAYKLMENPLEHRRCAVDPSHDWLPPFVSPRIALQTLGTEWGRRLYNDVWIDAAFARIKATNQFNDTQGYALGIAPQDLPVQDWVITDGRFKNEARRSYELGAKVIKLTRGLLESKDMHPSEAELRTMHDSDFDAVFNNAQCTLEQLPGAVAAILQQLRGVK